MFRPRLLTPLLILSICGCTSHVASGSGLSSDAVNSSPFPDEREAISAQIGATGFSGVVAVVRDAEPIFLEAYGLENRATGTPNTPETRFSLASTGKLITAIALMKLIEEGKVALSDPVGRFLPEYPNETIRERATVMHLLKMQSGLGDIFGERMDEAKRTLRTHDDYVRLFDTEPLAFKPGTNTEYSNAGYILLGRIIEEASGQDFYSYVQSSIFDPVGMTSSGYDKTGEIPPGTAIGYRVDGFDGIPESPEDIVGRALVPNSAVGHGTAAGGGYSTVGDFARLDRALRSGNLISSGSLTTIFSKEFVDGKRGAGLAGGAPGVSTRYRLRSDGTSIIVFGNTDLPSAPSISRLIETKME